MIPEDEQRQNLIDELHAAFLARWYGRPRYRDQVTRIFLDWIKANASNKALMVLIRQVRALPEENSNEQQPR